MIIDEAITNLECLEQSEEAGLEDDEKDAIKLGIEALGRIRSGRVIGTGYYLRILPGETKD